MQHPKTSSPDYLMNAQIIAQAINTSNLDVEAYWFFTPYTIPNKPLLQLLSNKKHHIGLHIINNPQRELRALQLATEMPILYYTIHGTTNILSQLIWHRQIGQKTLEIEHFPLQKLSAPTFSFDKACYKCPIEKAVQFAYEEISVNHILSMHPEWLFKSNKKDRGPFYEPLTNILLSKYPI